MMKPLAPRRASALHDRRHKTARQSRHPGKRTGLEQLGYLPHHDVTEQAPAYGIHHTAKDDRRQTQLGRDRHLHPDDGIRAANQNLRSRRAGLFFRIT